MTATEGSTGPLTTNQYTWTGLCKITYWILKQLTLTQSGEVYSNFHMSYVLWASGAISWVNITICSREVNDLNN